jgi:hypothetical protein
MERVIVEVKLHGEDRGRDLEVAPDLPVAELAGVVAQALGWPHSDGPAAGYAVEATPPGRTLRPNETLADAQAWDGATLVFRRRDAQAAPQPQQGFAWTQLA